MYFYDIETLGVESTSVILSIGCVFLDITKDQSYEEILDQGIFIKFNAEEQVLHGRTMDDDTCAWWAKQAEVTKEASFYPNPQKDLTVQEGLAIYNQWYKERKKGTPTIWVRGGLDQLATESLYKAFGVKQVMPYNRFYDVRTYIDFHYPNTDGGYVGVDPAKCADWDLGKVIKHHPLHDAAYDAAMLLYGITE